MRVEVQVDLRTARELHAGAEAGARCRALSDQNEVQHIAQEFGVTVTPVHPGQTHKMLASFFFVDVSDRATADRVVKRLQLAKGVEAAWVRPTEELP